MNVSMNASLREKLTTLEQKYQSLNEKLADPDIAKDQNTLRAIGQERAQLAPIVDAFAEFTALETRRADAEALLADTEMQALAQEEIDTLIPRIDETIGAIFLLLLPKDPDDDSNIYLEIRAGTGGDEAGIFAGDLFRMYVRYAENNGWHVDMMSANESEHGGFKEVVAKINGRGAYSRLKFESGAHRVQRVPETETQGRIHTSACTVAVLPEMPTVARIAIDMSDLRIDTFRASGAGGQHVNKTDSAIRITHLPTGLVVECQEERSQHKNKAKALALLSAKLTDRERQKQQETQAQTRKALIGSGDRSERIRTYNFPQSRVTDHRIGLTLYTLDQILQGDLDTVLDALAQEHQATQLAEIQHNT